MGRVVLESATTTALKRITVHGQYNHRALGFYVLSNLVPIVLNVREPGPSYRRVILVFGQRNHERSPFQDFGIRDICCQSVYAFNIRHYVQCFLPAQMGSDGQPTAPFTYNNCQYCGVTIHDAKGHTIQSIVSRSYRPDKFVYRAGESLQDEHGPDDLFKFHKGVL